ncbi:hypothetical protein CLAIMM_11839 [Cladophialophora immunda]|nr:hypothetical protein CLAIMM_11839 [Cladophialophora immunda]
MTSLPSLRLLFSIHRLQLADCIEKNRALRHLFVLEPSSVPIRLPLTCSSLTSWPSQQDQSADIGLVNIHALSSLYEQQTPDPRSVSSSVQFQPRPPWFRPSPWVVLSSPRAQLLYEPHSFQARSHRHSIFSLNAPPPPPNIGSRAALEN